MNGWEFLDEYAKLDKEIQDKATIVILTTADNAEEVTRAKTYSFVSDYLTKPLTKEIVSGIHKYFEKGIQPNPKRILLIDDDNDDNFFHERTINKAELGIIVVVKTTGKEALEYLKSKQLNRDPHIDLIFLDINMPSMSGWEFLEEYNLLDEETRKQAKIIMLSTTDSITSITRAKAYDFVSDFITKPLTIEFVKDINKYFK
jgi:CheY-like chemotaxis protein